MNRSSTAAKDFFVLVGLLSYALNKGLCPFI